MKDSSIKAIQFFVMLLITVAMLTHSKVAFAFDEQAIEQSSNQSALPATAFRAKSALDLYEFPMLNLVGEPTARVISRQSYRASGHLVELADQLRERLQMAGCKELEGASFTDSYGSALFEKEGFVFSLTLSPSAAGETMVSLVNHGNVPPSQLPVATEMTPQFSTPILASYLSSSSPEKATIEMRALLTEQGWKDFGQTAVSFFMKQNAIIVQVMVTAAPALQGQTMVQLTSEQISADLPCPPYSGVLQYSDATGIMLFDSDRTQAELVDYFRQELSLSEWKATTETPIRIGFRDHLIFRNPSEEYLELDFQKVDDKVRTRLTFKSAKQFAESEAKAQLAIAEKQRLEMERKKARNAELLISLPTGCKLVEATGRIIELSVNSGKAQSFVSQWLDELRKEGWEIEVVERKKEFGQFSLSLEKRQLEMHYVDPGIIPGSVTLRARSELQLKVKE